MKRPWLYFGCRGSAGHFLVWEQGQHAPNDGVNRTLSYFDGQLAPINLDGRKPLYQAVISRLPGVGYSAMSWWDQSVDTRSGSNSIVFAPDLAIDFDRFMAGTRDRFAWVLGRLPQPLAPWEPR